MEISRSDIFEMEQIGVGEISAILANPTWSELEQDIILAIHWMALSVGHHDLETKFLNLISSLEALIPDRMFRENGPTIIMGTANLIGKDGEHRSYTKGRIGKMWDRKLCFPWSSHIGHGS